MRKTKATAIDQLRKTFEHGGDYPVIERDLLEAFEVEQRERDERITKVRDILKSLPSIHWEKIREALALLGDDVVSANELKSARAVINANRKRVERASVRRRA